MRNFVCLHEWLQNMATGFKHYTIANSVVQWMVQSVCVFTDVHIMELLFKEYSGNQFFHLIGKLLNKKLVPISRLLLDFIVFSIKT